MQLQYVAMDDRMRPVCSIDYPETFWGIDGSAQSGSALHVFRRLDVHEVLFVPS